MFNVKSVAIYHFSASVPALLFWSILTNAFLLIATFLVVRLAYFTSDNLLQNFIYRIPLDAVTGLFGFGIIALLAVFTVSFESIKASIATPVKSLDTNRR